MAQTNIFDYLEEVDPVFLKVKQLKKGKCTDVEGVLVTLNQFGLYEIEASDIHETFISYNECYEWIIDFLDYEMLRVEND